MKKKIEYQYKYDEITQLILDFFDAWPTYFFNIPRIQSLSGQYLEFSTLSTISKEEIQKRITKLLNDRVIKQKTGTKTGKPVYKIDYKREDI